MSVLSGPVARRGSRSRSGGRSRRRARRPRSACPTRRRRRGPELVGRQLAGEVARLELLQVDVESRCSELTPLRCSWPDDRHGDARVLELLLELGRIEVLELVGRVRRTRSGISPSMPVIPRSSSAVPSLSQPDRSPLGSCMPCMREERQQRGRERALHVQALPVEQGVDVDRVAAAERAERRGIAAQRRGGDRQVDAALAGGLVDDELDRLGLDLDRLVTGRGDADVDLDPVERRVEDLAGGRVGVGDAEPPWARRASPSRTRRRRGRGAAPRARARVAGGCPGWKAGCMVSFNS